MLSITFSSLSLFNLLVQIGMSVREMFSQISCISSLGLNGFEAAFTDGLRHVCGFAISVGTEGRIMSDFASCPLLFYQPGMVRTILSTISLFSVSVCH